MSTTNQLHDSHVDDLIYIMYLDLPFENDEADEAFVKYCEQQHNGVHNNKE